MKNKIKFLLQNILGFKNYLFLFSLFTIRKALSRRYEPGFSLFVDRIRNGGIVLDVGANIGITAIPIALNHKSMKVHAFEPIAENFATLQKVVSFHKAGNVSTFNIALGNKSGQLRMIMPLKGKARQQGLSKVYVEGSTEKGIIYDVPVKRLDDLYPEEEISAIKIDVENFEYEVLSGAVNLIRRCHPMVYCELWNNDKRQMVFELFQTEGYSIYIFDAESNSLVPLKDKTTPECNFFLLPEEKKPGF